MATSTPTAGTLSAVGGADDAVVLTLDLTYTADPASATVYKSFAGDITSGQGSASGSLTGNVHIDEIDEDDASAGFKIMLYLQGGTELNNEYTMFFMEADGAVVGTPVEFDTTVFSIRSSISLTMTDADDVSISTDSNHYHYPAAMTTRVTGTGTGFTLFKGTISGGAGSDSTYENHQVHVMQDSDNIGDWLAVDQPDASGNFEVYIKAGATAITDTASQLTNIRIMVLDSRGRYAQDTYNVALMANPTLNFEPNTTARTGTHTVDGTDYSAYDEIVGAIPIAKVTLTSTPTGSVGTFSMSGNSSLGIGGTFESDFADNGSGKVRVTYSDAGDTSNIGDYLNVGDYVNLGGEYGDALVTAIIDATNFDTDADYAGGNDNTNINVAMINSGGAHVVIAATQAASNISRITLASSGQLLYTENGYTFDVMQLASQSALEVYKFDALKAADFTVTLPRDSDNAYLVNGTVLEVDSGATKSLLVTWDATKGLGDVDLGSLAIALDSAYEQPANTNLVTQDSLTDNNVVLQGNDPTAVDATTGATGITITLSEHDTNTFAAFFDASAGSTKNMEMSFSVTMTNTLSGAAATIAAAAPGETLRVWQALVANEGQTVFHIDYSDTGNVYADGTVLLNYLHSGGGFDDYTETDISSSEVVASDFLDINEATDDLELTGTAPINGPTSVSDVALTIADRLTAGTASSVTLANTVDVHLFKEPAYSFDNGGTAITGVPTSDSNVNTATVIEYGMAISGGHPLISTGAVRQNRSLEISYSDSNTLVCTMADTTGYTASANVYLKGSHANYNSSAVGLYVIDSVVEDTSVTMSLVSGSLTDAGSNQVGTLELRDSSLSRQPVAVTVGTSAGDNDSISLFDVMLYENGAGSTLRVRLINSDASQYSGNTFFFTLTVPAYSASPDADGAVGSSGELWASSTTTLQVTLSNASWDLGTRTSTILTNFGTGSDPNDSLYDYDDANNAQTLLLGRALTVSGINFVTEPMRIVVAAVDDFQEATINTAATIDYDTVVAVPDGISMQISKDSGTSWSNTATANVALTDGDEFESGDMLRIVVDLTNANLADGDKYLIMMVTDQNSTLSGGRVSDSFMRKAEVRYSGGLADFTLAAVNGHSWPGAASFELSEVTAYNSSGTLLSQDPTSFTWDVKIDAAVLGASATEPAATASSSVWNWPVLAASTNVAASVINETHLRYLPDNLPVTTASTLPSDGATSHKSLYNTSSGLNYASDNNNMMRLYIRVGLRRYSTAAGAAASDDEYVYKVQELSVRTTDVSSNVISMGQTYARMTAADDGIHWVRVGLAHTAWTNSDSEVLNVYAFSRIVAREKMVNDDDVISGSEAAS